MKNIKTALYNLHQKHGAKFVSFAGYEMPIQYKEGIVKEHISTRSYAGFFDVSHMGQFYLEGDDTLTSCLEKIIPADLKSLKLNHSKYSFLLNDNGGIIDDLIITKTKKGFCIILNAAAFKIIQNPFLVFVIIKSSIIPPLSLSKKEYFEWFNFKDFKSAGIIFSKQLVKVSSPSK